MTILSIAVLILTIGILAGVGVARFIYVVIQSSKTHIRVPDRPDKRRIDEALMRSWRVQNLERSSKALLAHEEEPSGKQTDIEENISTHERVSRCAPQDLVTLALTDVENIWFDDKLQLYYALRELNHAYEYRHMGNLPFYLEALARLKWTGGYTKEEVIEFDWRFWKVLEESGKDLVDQMDELYCTVHFRRFVPDTIQDIKIAVCPVCKKVAQGIKADRVVARLDEATTWNSYQQGRVFWVNVIKSILFFDFDEIEIGHCTLDQVTAFCIEAGNDPWMASRTQKIHYYIMADVVLDDQARVQLDKVFKGELKG